MMPGLDLRETPQLYLGAAEDESNRSERMRAAVAQAISGAESEPLAADLIAKHKAAADGVQRLDTAARFLREYTGTLTSRLETLEGAYLDQLISAAAESQAPDTRAFSEALRIEHEKSLIGEAIKRISDRLRPAAEIERLNAEALACLGISSALLEIGNARAGRLMERLAEAANDEICLPIDTRQGLIGAILAQASAYEEKAGQLAQQKSKLERAYEGGKK